MSDSPGIWVRHLSPSVHLGGCLIMYAARNGYGKEDRVPVTAQWFIMHRHKGNLIFFIFFFLPVAKAKAPTTELLSGYGK